MRFLFLLLDAIAFFTLNAIILNIRTSSTITNVTFKVMVPIFILNVILLFIFSFYDFKYILKKQINHLAGAITAFAVSFVVSSTGIYFGATLFKIPTPKTNLLLVLLIFYIYVFISRKFYDSLHFSQVKILSIGTSRTLNRIKNTLNDIPDYKIVYDFKDTNEITNIPSSEDIDLLLISNSILEKDKNIANIIYNHFVSKGIFCLTDLDFFEHIFYRLPKETLRNTNLLIKNINTKNEHLMYLTVKRIIDILFSLCLIPIFFPLGLIIYFSILIVDKQNPIFFQERVGYKGKTIQICKFRTLVTGTEKVTKMGKILRKFRLDEVPQLINILDGEISIVGPRPLYTKDYELLNKYIPVHSLRSIVKPGLTGWAQLNFGAPCNYFAVEIPQFQNDNQKNEYFKDAYVRLAYDAWYIKNASLKLDCEIMFKTAKRAFVKDKKLSS